MNILKKKASDEFNINSDALTAALNIERSLIAKISARETELGAAKGALASAEQAYLSTAAEAPGPDDAGLKAKRLARETAKETVEFLQAALAGDRAKLAQAKGSTFQLKKADHLKRATRLVRRRQEAAERLAKTMEQYALDVLGFYEASGLILTSDATPGRQLSHGALVSRPEIASLIETELARLNPVTPLEQSSKVVLPCQAVPLLGNPRTATSLIDSVQSANAHVLKIIANGPAPENLEATND